MQAQLASLKPSLKSNIYQIALLEKVYGTKVPSEAILATQGEGMTVNDFVWEFIWQIAVFGNWILGGANRPNLDTRKGLVSD